MFKLNLQFDKGLRWTKAGNIHLKGYFFDQGDKLYQNANDAQDYFSNCNSKGEFEEKLKEMNGSFAVVIQNKNKVLAAVDRLRSIPLFYSSKDNTFYLSDNAYWIKKELSLKSVNKTSKQEFLTIRYVTNRDTLFESIKQIQGGESLMALQQNNKINLRRKRYFRYLHQNLTKKNKKKIYSELNEISERVFKRLIRSIDNAPIVIPLSGGYDSRYVATMLKKLGYKKVFCFSYGEAGNEEAKISQKVAERLGYRWFFIKYQPQRWLKWFSSKERREYQKFAENLCSVMHIQDFLAVKVLKKRKLIPKNSVFVPGHSGDMLGGSQAPQKVSPQKEYSLNDVIKYLSKHSQALAKNRGMERFNKLKKVLYKVYREEKLTPERYVNLIESYILSNKVAKFVINSVRVYEFYNYEWKLPLWDNELINFWLKIPLKFRKNNKLYNQYLLNLFADYQIDFEKKPKPGYLVFQIKQAIKKLLPKNIFHEYRLKQDNLAALKGIELFFEKNNLDSNEILGKKFNSYLAKLQINNLNKDLKSSAIKTFFRSYNGN